MLTRSEFVLKYTPYVMKLIKGTNIFPETIFAQAIIESQGLVNGTYYPLESKLSREAKNIFGIKAGSNWKGKVYNTLTAEYDGNDKRYEYANFRAYNSFEDSFKDYVDLLTLSTRYAQALKAKTFLDQVTEIKKAGYSTSPTYAVILYQIGISVRNKINEAIESIKDTNKKTFIASVIGLLMLKLFLK